MPSKSEILKKLNKGLGLPDKKEFDPTLFALKLSKQVADTASAIKAIQETIVKQLSTNREADVAKQEVLEKQYGELIALQTKLLQAIQERKIEKVTVERVVERPPESVKVNLAYPDQEKRDEERRGLFTRLKDAATDTLLVIQSIVEEIKFSRTEKGAIAVRLVTANGEDFYNAVMTVVGGGSSAGGAGGATDVSALLTEATFTGRVGEVQANPTANTLLGRLKSLEDKIDTLQTELNQKYEGGAITANLGTIADVATQTTLALIKAKTDNLDAAISTLATATGQTTIIGHVDGIEAALTTIQGYIDQIEGYVDGLETSLTTLLGKAIYTATVSGSLDSRIGIDIQHSSVASKNLVDFHSDDAGHRLLGGAEKVLSPGGTRATYFDLNGYEGVYFSFTDNSPGASGGVMYCRWSRDAANTAYNDPGDGTGFTNYDGVSTASLVGAIFIPKKTRYVNFVFVQGGTNQGSTYPQIAQMDITAYPNFFTNKVEIATQGLPVIGPTDIATYGLIPVIAGGVDSVSAPTASIPQLMSATGQGSIQGTSTIFTGTSLVVAKKLFTTASPGATTLAVAASSTQVFASNTDRMGFHIYNDSPEIVYIKRGTAASATSYDWIILPYDDLTVYEPGYSGVIHHIAAVATGNLRCSEW